MTSEQLLLFKGSLCRFRNHQNPDWMTGHITAVMSDLVSVDGYPYSRDGLEVVAINGSNRPLEPDMKPSELSAFLDSIHAKYEDSATCK